MTRESLKKMTLDEIQPALEAELVAYAETVTNTPLEDLTKLEEELMKEFKEYDETIKDVVYLVPDEVEYDGVKYKASDVQKKIIGMLNKLEVDFRATLGIYQAIRFWKTIADNKVPYNVYDSTVRLLGTLKFKGESECLDVLVVNNYFAPTHAEYSTDTTWLQFLTAKHQMILKAMEERETPEQKEAVKEVQEAIIEEAKEA